MSTTIAENRTKGTLVERGPGFHSGLSELPKNLNAKTITTGIISTVFGCTGPCLVTIDAATTAGYSTSQIVSWVFGIYVFGGLLGAVLALYYKQPISGAFSIPGASMMGAALMGYTFQEAAGAFVIAGVLVFLLGVSGLIGKVMRWLPLPIVMGMIGGCMLRFGTGIVSNAIADPIVCGLAVLAFLVVPRMIKGFPGVLAAMAAGVVAAVATGAFNPVEGAMVYVPPQLVIPEFNPALILSCSVPLAALVIGAENAQAIGVLYTQGYKPPINSMTIFSGVGGVISGLVGAHNANIAGPMTAICSSDEAGKKEGRYAASVVNGMTFAAFGLVGSFAIAFVSFIPGSLVNVLAGLAMINVLIQAFSEGFKNMKYKTGAFAALAVGVANQSILGIGAAFWALVIGVLVSLICDSKDFTADRKENHKAATAV